MKRKRLKRASKPTPRSARERQFLGHSRRLPRSIANITKDHAWAWIYGHPRHGPAICKTESEIDRIGNKGNPEQLQAACNPLVKAWRAAIEEWRKEPR
jgi:hypothetical protein